MKGKDTKEKMLMRSTIEKLVDSRCYRTLPSDKLSAVSGTCLDADYALEEMDEAIRYDGILTPLLVAGPYEDGTYKVVDGMRRLNSVKQTTGEANVPCYVVAGPDATDSRLVKMALSANIIKRDDSGIRFKLELSKALAKETEEGSLKRGEACRMLSELTNITPRYGRSLLNIAQKASESTIDAVKDGKVSVMDASKIVNAFPKKEAEQKEILEKVMDQKAKDTEIFRKSVSDIIAEKQGDAAKRRKKEIVMAVKYIRDLIDADDLDAEMCADLITVCTDFLKKYQK